MQTRDDAQHVPALDGVRGIAVMLVVLLHFVPLSGMTELGTTGRLVSHVTTLGGIGVDIFFVLSGFLITGILLKTKGSPSNTSMTAMTIMAWAQSIRETSTRKSPEPIADPR